MTGVEKEDWTEMVRVLREVEKSIAALSDGDFKTEIARSRKYLLTFYSTAGRLGLSDLEKAGRMLENYLGTQVDSSTSMDTFSAFGFSVSLLADQVRDIGNGKGTGALDMSEIIEILGPIEIETAPAPVKDKAPGKAPAETPAPAAQQRTETAAAPKTILAEELGSSRFAEMLKSLGGELSITPNGKSGGGKFSVTFSGSSESLQKLDAIFAGGEISPEAALPRDNKLEKIISRGKDVMAALSAGDMARAQELLLNLADQQQQVGLYKEIGGLARGLHDSIRSFINTMDPSIKEIVEDKIPDSGNRLEHMLKLTETAAITTLDHVEAMQDRLESEHEHLSKIRQLLAGLKPVGAQAVKKMSESAAVLDGLEKILSEHRGDLDIILTAQDYQDLSGQIIQKITVLLKDLELKLVNMIRTFGVKSDIGKKKESDELYGPAHEAREDTVHSQDEVDSLLAEFGF